MPHVQGLKCFGCNRHGHRAAEAYSLRSARRFGLLSRFWCGFPSNFHRQWVVMRSCGRALFSCTCLHLVPTACILAMLVRLALFFFPFSGPFHRPFDQSQKHVRLQARTTHTHWPFRKAWHTPSWRWASRSRRAVCWGCLRWAIGQTGGGWLTLAKDCKRWWGLRFDRLNGKRVL